MSTGIAIKGPLSPLESARLAELEPIIQRGMTNFVEVGLALAEIKDLRLYKVDFSTFEDYCREKWGWTKQHAYRLIAAVPLAKGNPQVTSINQARELAKVEPEQRANVIKVASTVAAAECRPMTARDIKQAAEPEPKPDHSPEGALSQRRFPSQNTQPKFVHWWIRANPRQRSLHLPMLFNHRVVVKSKAQVREMVENWFEHWVEEATPTPLPATEAA